VDSGCGVSVVGESSRQRHSLGLEDISDLRQYLVIKREKILANRVQGSGTWPGPISLYFFQGQDHILYLNLGQDYLYNTPHRNNNDNCSNTYHFFMAYVVLLSFTPHNRSLRQELSFTL